MSALKVTISGSSPNPITMERILKFRAYIPEAKHPYSDGMYYQKDQYLSSFLRRIRDQFEVTHDKYLPFSLSERLMQFTGLLDKEGNEIYEGDITRIIEWPNNLYPNHGVPNVLIGKIEFYRDAWRNLYHDARGDWNPLYDDAPHLRIIGNIFQHPPRS